MKNWIKYQPHAQIILYLVRQSLPRLNFFSNFNLNQSTYTFVCTCRTYCTQSNNIIVCPSLSPPSVPSLPPSPPPFLFLLSHSSLLSSLFTDYPPSLPFLSSSILLLFSSPLHPPLSHFLLLVSPSFLLPFFFSLLPSSPSSLLFPSFPCFLPPFYFSSSSPLPFSFPLLLIPSSLPSSSSLPLRLSSRHQITVNLRWSFALVLRWCPG